MDKPQPWHYLNLISEMPFIVVRILMVGKPGKRKYQSRWRDIVRGFTPLMHELGMRAKDLHTIDGILHPDAWDEEYKDPIWGKHKPAELERAIFTRTNVELAFAGDFSHYEKFWLYEWDATLGRFNLVRRAADALTESACEGARCGMLHDGKRWALHAGDVSLVLDGECGRCRGCGRRYRADVVHALAQAPDGAIDSGSGCQSKS